MKRKTLNKAIALFCAVALTCSSGSLVSAVGSPSGQKITSVVKEVEIKTETGEVKKVEVFAENMKLDLSNAKNKGEEKKIIKDYVEKVTAPIVQHIENVAKDLGLNTNSGQVKQLKKTVEDFCTAWTENVSSDNLNNLKKQKENNGTFKDDTIVKTEPGTTKSGTTESGTTTIRIKDVENNTEETLEISDVKKDIQSISEVFLLKMREKNVEDTQKTGDTEETDKKEQGETIVLDDNFELEIKLDDLGLKEEAEEDNVMYIVSVYSLENIEIDGEICQVMVESFVNATIETVEVEPEAETEKPEAETEKPEAETEKQKAETEKSKKDAPKKEKVLRAVLPPNAFAAEVKKVKKVKKNVSTKEEIRTNQKETDNTKREDNSNGKNKTSNKKEK